MSERGLVPNGLLLDVFPSPSFDNAKLLIWDRKSNSACAYLKCQTKPFYWIHFYHKGLAYFTPYLENFK